jgi:hypothetical protein
MNRPAIYSPEEFVDDFEDLGLDRRISKAKERVANGEEGATTLVVLPSNLAEAFKPGGLTTFIEAVRKKDAEFQADISSEPGRRALKSHCYKIARTKTGADDAGKQFGAELKAQVKAIDGERKRMCDELDKINAERRKPLTEWENIDKERVAAHEAALAEVMAFGEQRRAGATAFQLARMLDDLKPFKERKWEEFSDRAKKVIGNTEHYLKEALSAAVKAEAEAEELARFRKEAAERAQKERDERIAKEAAEKARKEAEEKARIEAEWLQDAIRKDKEREEAEHRASEKARQDAEDRAFAAETERIASEKRAADAEKRQKEMKAAQEKQLAEMKIAAEKRAKELAAKAEADKKEAAKRAVEAERKRAEEERKRLAEIEAKRQADEKHRKLIRSEALSAMESIEKELDSGPLHSWSERFFAAIVAGKIPHITINY